MEYESYKIVCPFYKDESKNAVRCEGFISSACTNNFISAEEKKKHKNKYCTSKYQECPHAKEVEKLY